MGVGGALGEIDRGIWNCRAGGIEYSAAQVCGNLSSCREYAERCDEPVQAADCESLLILQS